MTSDHRTKIKVQLKVMLKSQKSIEIHIKIIEHILMASNLNSSAEQKNRVSGLTGLF